MFQCALCSREFKYHKNLRKHVRNSHKADDQIPSLKKDPATWFQCSFCPGKYRSKILLRRHQFKNHEAFIQKSKNNCPLQCSFNSRYKGHLILHLKTSHDIEVETETLNFPTYEVFWSWKSKMENETKSKYVVSRTKIITETATNYYFCCHRSGNFISESKGLRKLKKSSNKINGICPASIKVVQDNCSGQCKVLYSKTHVGHSLYLGETSEHNPIINTVLNELNDSRDDDNNLTDFETETVNNEDTSNKTEMNLADRKRKATEMFQEVLSSVISFEEIDAIDKILAEMKSSISAACSSNGISVLDPTNIEGNPIRTKDTVQVKKHYSRLSKTKSFDSVKKKRKIILSSTQEGTCKEEEVWRTIGAVYELNTEC